MAADKQERGRPFHALHDEQMERYAAELAGLYRALRSQASSRLGAEKQLRVRGTHAETVHQILAAAHIAASLAAAGDLPLAARQKAAERLPRILDRGLRVARDYRRELGLHGRDDLGLAALLREEVCRRSAEWGCDVEVEAETVQPSALVQTSAYLIVWEALEWTASDPNVTKLSLTMRTEAKQLLITVTSYRYGPEPERRSVDDDPAFLLMRLYARLVGGSCRWASGRNPAATRMELALPLDGEQPGEARPPER